MFDASITSIKSFKTNTHFRIHQLAGAHPGDRREKCKNNIKVSHSHMTRDRRKKKQRRPTIKLPHSFEESPSRAAIDIQEDDEQQTLGAKPFAPRYPVYKFGEGAPSTAATSTATATTTLTTTPTTPAEMTTIEPVKGSNGVS
uniref:(northern house mosquito) hypothetical protein n=1 Tax=Culex pipiens TaxID=7175 RepID=A0A8D8JSZ8_CULPI